MAKEELNKQQTEDAQGGILPTVDGSLGLKDYQRKADDEIKLPDNTLGPAGDITIN